MSKDIVDCLYIDKSNYVGFLYRLMDSVCACVCVCVCVCVRYWEYSIQFVLTHEFPSKIKYIIFSNCTQF